MDLLSRWPADYPRGVALALWTGQGPLASARAALPLLADLRPQATLIHGRPSDLLAEAAAACALVETGGPVLMQVSGDWLADVHLWPLLPTLCKSLGIRDLVLNCEPAWYGKAGRAAEAMATTMVAALAADVRVGHTSFGWPARVDADGMGGHPDYPWAAFCGPGSAHWTAPQVYWRSDGGTSLAPRGTGDWYWQTAQRSWAETERLGWHREGIPYAVYLQTYRVHRADLCAIGVEAPLVLAWASHLVEEHGRQALTALAELHRRGYCGAGAIQRWQTDAGLVADGIVGPLTLGSLGVAL